MNEGCVCVLLRHKMIHRLYAVRLYSYAEMLAIQDNWIQLASIFHVLVAVQSAKRFKHSCRGDG